MRSCTPLNDGLLTCLCLWVWGGSPRTSDLNELNIVFWDVPHIKHDLDGPQMNVPTLYSKQLSKDATVWLKKSLVPKKKLLPKLNMPTPCVKWNTIGRRNIKEKKHREKTTLKALRK